nr:MAG TPA: hypothetical protein [Caudoviricetes sp.]
MSKIEDGGPVFPTLLKAGNVAKSDGGMSLRDYFAGQALPIAELRGETTDRIADWAYAIADAMLAERSKGGA